MSKRFQFEDTSQKNSRAHPYPSCCPCNAEKSIKNASSSNENSSTASFKISSLSKHLGNHKIKRRKDILRDPSDSMRSKKTEPTITASYDGNLNEKYIDALVCKIKELKNHVKSFKNEYPLERIVYEQNFVQHFDENQSINDKMNRNGVTRFNHGDDIIFNDLTRDCKKKWYSQKLSQCTKNSDHPRSIYTVNRNDVNTFPSPQASYIYQSSPKNLKIKSNLSRGVSTHQPTNKSNRAKLTLKSNPKQFQAAAEQFIDQAEELKTKIAFLLECCGINPAISDSSGQIVSASPSESPTFSNANATVQNNRANDSSPKQVLDTIQKQYSTILDALFIIQNQINTFNRHTNKGEQKPCLKVPPKIAKSNLELHKRAVLKKHKNLSSSRNTPMGDKMSFHLDNTEQKIPEISKCLSDVALMNAQSKRKPSNNLQQENGKVHNHSKSAKHKEFAHNKNLEAVVMVYEPIYSTQIDPYVCQLCGQGMTTCTASCSEDTILTMENFDGKGAKKANKRQNYGFVVSYTPDLSPPSDTNTTATSTKGSRKQKKKIMPCLWF